SLAVRIIRTAIDNGITFMDNSWDYHKGASEKRLGKALREGYRDRAFVMTKIDGRTAESANTQLEESLRRLKVDCIDLVQHLEIKASDGGGMPAVRAQSPDVGRHHRHRQYQGAQSGDRGGSRFSAAERDGDASPARESETRRHGRVRALQDLEPLRLHRRTSRMARRGAEADAADGRLGAPRAPPPPPPPPAPPPPAPPPPPPRRPPPRR